MKNWLLSLVFVLICPLAFADSPPAGQPVGTLVVFGNEACPFCRVFDREVGQVYPRTPIASVLPMVSVDTLDPPPEWAEIAQTVCFTPTFLFMDAEGNERARLQGYRGEEFFWGDLERVIDQEFGLRPDGSRRRR